MYCYSVNNIKDNPAHYDAFALSGQRNSLHGGAGIFIMEEIWKDISGFKNNYECSSFGRIRRKERVGYLHNKKRLIPSIIIKQTVSSAGYYRCNLFYSNIKKHYLVHRIVAKLFIDNPLNKSEVNHINGIKTDNRAENLQWVTHKENIAHADKTGLRKMPSCEAHVHAKFTNEQIKLIRADYDNKLISISELSKMHSVSYVTMFNIIKRKTWKGI